MPKLRFDTTGTRFFEMGDKNAVLFVMATATDTKPTAPADMGITMAQSDYKAGVAWMGITGWTDSPSGGEETELWADNIKYASFRSAEKSGGTIESYTIPTEFEECDGAAVLDGVIIGQQSRKKFGAAYITQVGNDQDQAIGEKLHLVYNASASPSERSYTTINDNPDAITFSHEYSADQVAFTAQEHATLNPVATLTIDTTKLVGGKTNKNYRDLCDIIFGRDASGEGATAVTDITAQLPSPDDVLFLMHRELPSG